MLGTVAAAVMIGKMIGWLNKLSVWLQSRNRANHAKSSIAIREHGTSLSS